MKKRIWLPLLLLSFAAGAAEIYVSPDGNDKNSGSAKAPFRTIGFAASKAKPGDTVKIGPGVYREQITFRKSGKKGAPITFAGTRGKNGEYLTIIEAPGILLDKWVPAPEIAPEVWKVKLVKRPDLITLDGKMIAFINASTMALPRWKDLPSELNENMFWGKFGPNCKRLPGLDLLTLPKDILVRHRYFGKRKELFWPALGYVLSGWKDGFLYLRFANGEKPQGRKIVASTGEGFVLNNVSHLYFKDLHLRSCRRQFRLQGRSSHNTIDSCLLMHGGARVRIDEGVTHTQVKNSIMTSGFIRDDLFGLRGSHDMRSCLVYTIFKYIIGTSLSDDVGVLHNGKFTRITGNVFLRGLVGIRAYGPDIHVQDNVVREMASVGISTGDACTGTFTGNLVMNCGIVLRIHHLRGKVGTKREEFHYRNLYVQARHAGSQFFLHCASYEPNPDEAKIVKAAKNAPQTPLTLVDPGHIYIYHNTFWGGPDLGSNFTVRVIASKLKRVLPFFVVNNVIKGGPRMESRSQELFNGNLLYTFDPAMRAMPQRDPEIARRNKLIGVEETKKLWNGGNVPGLPDMTLKAGSPALECAIDISKPFTANGKKFTAFPGFAPGYFKGKAPAAGAFQQGESQEKFFRMHKRAEDIAKMLRNNK